MKTSQPIPLPSLEAQTVAYVDTARSSEDPDPKWLKFGGFYAYLRYRRNVEVPPNLVLGEVLVIATIDVPWRFQRRGWFWRYCQLCAALVTDGVIIESVANPGLKEGLRRHPAFIEYKQGYFLLRKSHPADWPLTLHPMADNDAS